MSNVLSNPTLDGFSLGRYFTDKEGKVGTIENPNNWEFVALAKESDPNKLPQSLHRDRGFVISAGYRSWEAAYVQKGVQLQANQRYLARAIFKPDINFPGGQKADLTAITWRFRMVAGDKVLEQDWTVTQKGQYKQEEIFEFVFETTETLTVEYQFWARSFYAGNDADVNVYQLTLEPVAADVGGSDVPKLGTAASAPAPVAKPAEPVTSTETTTKDTETVETPAAKSGKALGDVLTSAEIDEISASLRTLASSNPSAAAGLNTLADALDRLK